MFDDELIDGITSGLVGLDSRVGELERKENPAISGIGPFEFEVHVDIGGGGDYTSIASAAAYVLATSNGVDYWSIVVHGGDYTETAFTLPDNAALVGVGNATIFASGISGTYITLGDNCVMRDIAITLNMNPTAADCWAVECAGYLTLENCSINVARFGGSGSAFAIGVVKTETGDISNSWLRLRVQESSYPGDRIIVRFDDPNAAQRSYLRDCTLGFASASPITDETSSTIYVETHLLWVIDCTIQKRSSGDAGYDIEAASGAIAYTSGTLWVKSLGTVTNLDTAAGAIGTVTSVAMTVPNFLSVAGSPITTAGTLAVTLATQVSNRVFAGPATGADATPTFRALEGDDIPSLDASKIGSGVLGTAVGGTGASNATGSLSFNGVTNITGGGTLALGGYVFTVPATGTVALGGGSGAAGRVPVWSDANTLTSTSAFTFNTAFNSLLAGGRAGFGGITAFTEIYTGFVATTDAIIEAGSANVTVTDQHTAHLVLSTRQNNFPDKLIGAVSWVNRQSPYTADLRLAGIAAYTAADADEGYLTISTAPAGGGLLEALRVTQNQVLLVGKTSGLTSAGAVDIDGVLNVDGNTTLTTLTASGAVDLDTTLNVDGTTTLNGATTITAAGVGLTVDNNAQVTGQLSAGVAPPANIKFVVQEARDGDMTARFRNTSNGTAARVFLQFVNDTANAYLFLTSSAYTTVAGWQNRYVFNTDSGITGGILVRPAAGGFQVSANGTNNPNLFIADASGANSGFVGIGTAAPGALFDVFRTTGGVVRLSRDDTSVSANDMLGKVEFYGNDTQLSTQNIFGNIEIQAQAAIASDAAFGKMLLRTTGPGTATSPVERLGLGLVKTLTDAATNLFDVTLNAGEMAGGTVVWTIIASNGTDHQAYSGIVTYAVVNKAGAYTTQITHDAANDSKAVSSGTLTAAWTVLNGTNKVTIRVTPTGSLTETTYQILYSIHSNSPQSITVL